MATIVTRQTQLTPLTHAQVDQNFLNINAEAIQAKQDAATALSRYTAMGQSLNVLAGLGGAQLAVRSGYNSIGPLMTPYGSADNIDLCVASKGTSPVRFFTADFLGGAGVEQFRVGHTANAVNYVRIAGGQTGSGGDIRAAGSDANVSLNMVSKGGGSVNFYTNDSELQARVAHVTGAVNFLQIQGSASGNYPAVVAKGLDANTGLYYGTQGTGQHIFANGSSNVQFIVSGTANAVNYLQSNAGAPGVAPSLQTLGAATNIDLQLLTKGGGLVTFGTWTGSADVAINGSVTIKDSAGNIRKLATIA